MDDFVQRKRRFGSFLELAGPNWEARASALGLAASEQNSLIAEFSGKMVALGTSASAIAGVLGPPDKDDGDVVAYDLGVRSGYVFEFEFKEGLGLVGSGYARSRPVPLDLPESPAAAGANMLRGVTAREIVACWGEPSSKQGWWPLEDWYYGTVRVELRLGVVEEDPRQAAGEAGLRPARTWAYCVSMSLLWGDTIAAIVVASGDLIHRFQPHSDLILVPGTLSVPMLWLAAVVAVPGRWRLATSSAVIAIAAWTFNVHG